MIRCCIHRALISNAIDHGTPLSPRTERHLKVCNRCGAFWRSSKQIAERLSAEAPFERIEAPLFLHSRITAAIDRSDRLPERTGLTRLSQGVLALSLIALAAVLLLPYLTAPEPDDLIMIAFPSTPELLEKTAILLDGQKLLDFGQTIDQPLQNEINYVVSDARTAVQLLADSFLPEQFSIPR